jgi:hypothetical protein
VTRSTIAYFRRLWELNMSLLPPSLPTTRKDLPDAIREATKVAKPEEKTTDPALIPIQQETGFYCAPASAQMILQQHKINLCELVDNTDPCRGHGACDAQDVLACYMQTDRHDGTTPENQVSGFNKLSANLKLKLTAVREPQPTFDKARSEILANLPFKIGDPGHALAVGGYRLEASGKRWLHLNDPDRINQGGFCADPWDDPFLGDFMYVRPA